MDARTLSKGKMVAPFENVSSLLRPVQENYKLGVNNSNNNKIPYSGIPPLTCQTCFLQKALSICFHCKL